MVYMVLCFVAVMGAVSAVKVDFVPPGATSYIYRSDNNGPASLIQLGSLKYDQPHAFAAPLPLAQPLKFGAIENYKLGPAPLPYIAAKPIVVEDAEEDDDSDESSEEYAGGEELTGLDHGHEFEKGEGNDYDEKYHSAHGEKGTKGYLSKGHHDEGKAGHYDKEHGEGYYSDEKGEKKAHHDKVDAHGKHHESGESYKGGDHGHKKHFSKGEDVTGYHKIFHKDEFKKDHDFYDVADKSGHFKKHDYANEHHGSEKGAHKKGQHHDSASDKGEFGKKGYHAKGHIDDAHKGISSEKGQDSYYKHHEDFGKKGGSEYEKEHAFEDDDEEYDDDDKE